MSKTYEINYDCLQECIDKLNSLIEHNEGVSGQLNYLENLINAGGEKVKSDGLVFDHTKELLCNLQTAHSTVDELFISSKNFFEQILLNVKENDEYCANEFFR